MPGVLRPGIRSGRGTGNGEGAPRGDEMGRVGRLNLPETPVGLRTEFIENAVRVILSVQSRESVVLRGLAFLGPGGLRQASPDSVSLLGLPHRQPHIRNGRLSWRGAGEAALQVLAEVEVSERRMGSEPGVSSRASVWAPRSQLSGTWARFMGRPGS